MTIVGEYGVVEFRFFRPSASRVSVAGSFNGWREDALAMHPSGDGWWVATARLPVGAHRFRYVADGHWFTDFASHGVEKNYGGWDSVLLVGSRPAPDVLVAEEGRAQLPLQ